MTGGANPRLSTWNAHKLKLGFFAPNCSSGRSVTLLSDRWSGSWDQNLRLAQLADEVGIDFLLPIGRWKGYGGETDFHGTTLETITWATACLATTKKLVVFGTVHAPLFHPIVAAKQMVTADQVSHGRFGLNLVCGWNEGEFEMFGATLREHEQRYEYAQEWIDAITAMWSERENFDFIGEYFQLKGLRLKPKPYGGGRPIVMNAGSSPKGKAFAVRNCDAYFTATTMDALDSAADKVEGIRAYAREQGREIGVFTTAEVYCAPTRREAEERFHHVSIENADWSAVDAIMPMYGQKIDKSDPQYEETRRRFAHGLSGFLATGTPDDVAATFAKVSAAGFDGVAFSFFDYAADLPYFAQEVLPRLERLGIRAPSTVHAS
jgi:FMNH2-dependent dimethyl sulfone monooxygenase